MPAPRSGRMPLSHLAARPVSVMTLGRHAGLVACIRDVYTDPVGYEWLPGLIAILSDVEEYEVIQALANPRRWPRPMRDQRGNAFIAIWTRTNDGRPVIVTIRLIGRLDAQIVAARPMTPAETVQLEQWEQDHE
jgi:hypothetical protein